MTVEFFSVMNNFALPLGRRTPRNPHLQMLRCIAANRVVLDHAFGNLTGHEAGASRYLNLLFLGDTAVLVFFVLSGYVLMRQSQDSFGSVRNAGVFLFRRAVRIFPLYWLATLLWFPKVYRWGPTHLTGRVLLSLACLPNVFDPGIFPILVPTWTLNYEMFFYLLFACCLLLPLRKGIMALLGTLAVLGCVGWLHAASIGWEHGVHEAGVASTVAFY
jgi:exopolysaccharide production protein ExoZ